MRRLLQAILVVALFTTPVHAWIPTLLAGSTSAAAATTPTIRSVGASAAGVSAQTCPTPAGAASGDLLIMFLKTEDQAIDTNDAAWTESASSPNSSSGANRLTVFWLISDGTDDYLTTDSGLQNICVVVAITAGTFNAATPFNVTGFDDDASGTSVDIETITTTVNNVLVLSGSTRSEPDAAGSTEFSSEANASLTGVTERFDGTFLAGNGGALYIVSGVLATAGATGSTTATAATTGFGANISLGIAPP